jgi:protein-disulfide isomerase
LSGLAGIWGVSAPWSRKDIGGATRLEQMESSLKITRREFAIGTCAVALTGFAAVKAGFSGFDLIGPAQAQDPSPAELMKPGPLGDMVMGDEKAPVTIIEYASMTCPHCANFHETTYPELKKRYIDTGKVRFIFREFPLDQLAAAGFMLARCGTQDAGKGLLASDPNAGSNKYFAMVETLFSQQRDWVVQRPLQPLLSIAKQAGFSEQSFNECLKNQQVLEGIEEVRSRAAQKFNVQSTPTFFINGKIMRGSLTIDEFDKQLAPYLKDG